MKSNFFIDIEFNASEKYIICKVYTQCAFNIFLDFISSKNCIISNKLPYTVIISRNDYNSLYSIAKYKNCVIMLGSIWHE